MTNGRHIALDARWIFPELSGIGLFTQELIAGLVRLPSPHRYTLLFNREEVMARTAARTGFSGDARFTSRLVKEGVFAPSGQWHIPRLLSAWKIEVYHSTNYMMPLWMPSRIRRIVTIHDLIPLLFRDHAPRSKKNRLFPLYQNLMHLVVARANVVVADSQSTRTDILNHLLRNHADPGKVAVVPGGVRPEFKPAARTRRDDVVFLYVGRRDPYKNLVMLVRALAELRRRGLAAKLRVIGPTDPRYPEAPETAQALGVMDQIEWIGYVSEPELIAAYQQADVFVLPSLYEGFGLPVLEAMACGTPVICSATSSLPEVAGDAALFMDPAQPESLINAMARMATEPDLRDRLAKQGLIQAAKFSWDHTAREMNRIYETI